MSETDKIMTFVEELQSAMQFEVNYYMPDKLEDAMKMAINFDDAHFHKMTIASKSIAKPPPRREHIVYVPRLETPSSDTAEPMDLDAINQTKERFTRKADKTTSSNGRCYRCEKTRHIARNCKEKAKDKNIVMSTIEKSNEKLKKNAECHTMVKHPSEPEQLKDERERLIQFNGSVNKKKAWLLLDSGSAQNFIDKSFVK